MEFMLAASTDTGLRKKNNQDSLYGNVLQIHQGQVAFGILCDGMGGLAKGELASATVVRAFQKWSKEQLPELYRNGLTDNTVSGQWGKLVAQCNHYIQDYGKTYGTSLGTTVTVMLLTQDRYCVMNVGDSRAYEIKENLVQLTVDQTVIAREIELGRITPEQAKLDPRRNVLLQCIGASEKVVPDFFFGNTKPHAVYMLCSDGFRHEITAQELYQGLCPAVMTSPQAMQGNMQQLIALNKTRNEQDNISVLTIHAC